MTAAAERQKAMPAPAARCRGMAARSGDLDAGRGDDLHDPRRIEPPLVDVAVGWLGYGRRERGPGRTVQIGQASVTFCASLKACISVTAVAARGANLVATDRLSSSKAFGLRA